MDQTWADPRNAIPAPGALVPKTRTFQKPIALRVKLSHSCSDWAENGGTTPETQNPARTQNFSSIGATTTEILPFLLVFENCVS